MIVATTIAISDNARRELTEGKRHFGIPQARVAGFKMRGEGDL